MGETARKEYYRLEDAITASRDAPFFVALIEWAGSDRPGRIRLMADLLARRGKGDGRELLMIDEDMRVRLAAVLENWIEVMLTSPHANRHQFSDVARAAGRIRAPKLVDGLRRMLERDLTDWARAREEHARSERGGVPTPGVTHSYTLQYRTAFGAIGGAEVIALMNGHLPDLRFGSDAACALMDIWKQKHPSDRDKRFAAGHDFSKVKARRKQREDTQLPMPTCDSAEAIFAVVRELGTHDKDDTTQRQAIGLAKIGLGLPHGTKRDEIITLLNLPQPYAVKQGLLTAAAMAGEIVPADALIAGTRELLELAKKQSWRLDKNCPELMGWVELFAFSDRPSAVLDALNLLPAEHLHSWRLSRLLSALGDSPHADTLHVLKALARRDAQLLREHDWLNAIIKVGTEESARALLELVCDGTLMSDRRGVDPWHLSQLLARLGEEFPAMRDEMMQRYEGLSDGQPKAIIESALAELANAPIVLALIRSYAANKRPFDGRLAKTVRGLAVGQRPAGDWPGAYEEFSVSLTAVRKELFGMLAANDAQSMLAEAFLIAIEELRDEHGRIDAEPRHPDVESGRAWPREASATEYGCAIATPVSR